MKRIITVLLALVLLSNCKNTQVGDANPPKYKPDWESLKAYKIPKWFNDVKFGIFIHWGPYSVPAYGSEWYPRLMYMDSALIDPRGVKKNDGPTYINKEHLKRYGSLDTFGYKDFIPMFKAEKFNADEWVNLFKKAGAKYVVPVAEHHDAFAMYKSKHTHWNSVEMGPKIDVLGEIKKATKKHGLYFGASSHFAFNWDYFTKKKGFDNMNPKYADLYGRNHPPYSEVDQEFLDLWWKRTTDIIDNYQPDILWFDFMIDRKEFVPYHPKLTAYYYNKGSEWGHEVVLQTKNFKFQAFPDGVNVLDIERGKLDNIRKYPWQTDTSIGKNSWCYVTNWKSRTANSLIDDLIDIVSKNGNLLLNIGPKADGTIPNDQQEVLLQMGSWLEVNGEAIYDTRPWKIFGEGPTEVAKGHHSEGKNKDFTSHDFRFTSKDGVLYAIALAAPETGVTEIKALAAGSKLLKDNIKSVTVLGNDKTPKWEQTKTGLKVEASEINPDEFAVVYKIEFN